MSNDNEPPASPTPASICSGDLYWIIADPATEPASAYAHPHLVVQDDVFNRSRIASVVVCALTSNLQRASEPGNVLLAQGEGGLPRQSVIVVSRIDAVDKTRLGTRIGRLSPQRVAQVIAGLRFQQEAFLGPSR